MSNVAPAMGLGLRMIALLSQQSEEVGISEISRALGSNKNMVSRILNSLEEAGWVYKNPDAKYRLTLLPFQITAGAARMLPLDRVAEPYVAELWKRVGESTYLGIRKDHSVLYIRHYDSVRDVRVAGAVGGTYPLHCTAPGKVLLAHCEGEFIEEYLQSKPVRYTEHTLTARGDIFAELAKIRADGYATDREEYGSGIVCLAAPVYDGLGDVVGTVGCSFSTVNCDADSVYARCGNDILQTVRLISRGLGYSG